MLLYVTEQKLLQMCWVLLNPLVAAKYRCTYTRVHRPKDGDVLQKTFVTTDSTNSQIHKSSQMLHKQDSQITNEATKDLYN